ncbi:MAG TPA: hypothetical protein EYH15_03420 [Methanothermococcus okinawensis]|uniref:Uncharacterized protein n=1 Tax=Methanothermococcus okinawensis TaxID=155863 RepID=A0A832ZLN9_9EURY|nr:hypothetical protein [Methanothermococcus okinawensis]HIP91766.1 hypothetical protein [Methanothermococcus okinawensis]
MESKRLIRRLLIDIYKNLDEYSKDLIRACNYHVKFQGLLLVDRDTGERRSVESLEDCESLPSFKVEDRRYTLKGVNLEDVHNDTLEILLSSEISREYSFKVDRNYKVIGPNRDITYEHRERILKWNELSEEELDKKLDRFYDIVERISEELREVEGMENYNFIVYTDIFMDLDIVENIVERDGDMTIIWIHPLYLFSSESVLKGVIAYQLSAYNRKILEEFYRDILEYCREYKRLFNKNLNILKKIKDIAIKRKDKEVMDIIREIEEM